MLGVDGVRAYMTDYAKRAVLGSSAVVGMVGRLVESVACTMVESVVVGSVSYVLKEFVSPWMWTDVVVVDIGLNVVYILCAMDHVRTHFHHLFKRPCRRLARKILGLDIRDPWAFLRLKYTVMTTVMMTILVIVCSVPNLAEFVVLLYSETLVVHVIVDTWHMRGDRIRIFVSDQLNRMGTRPSVRIFESVEDFPEYVGVQRTASASASASASAPSTPTSALDHSDDTRSESKETAPMQKSTSGEHGGSVFSNLVVTDHFCAPTRRDYNTKL